MKKGNHYARESESLKKSRKPVGVKQVPRTKKNGRKNKKGKIHVLLLYMFTAMIGMITNACLFDKKKSSG